MLSVLSPDAPSAEDLDEVFELAVHNSTFSPFDSDALQYFSARE